MNLERLERMVGRPNVEKIVAAFLEHSQKRVAALNEALLRDDAPAAAAALHSLNASAGLLGASALDEIAQTLERAAMAGNLDAVRSGRAEFERVYRATTEALGGGLSGA